MKNVPAITKARPPFIKSLTLKGDDKPFAPLTDPANHGSLEKFNRIANEQGLQFSVEDYLSRDKYPLPETVDREYYYGEDHASYWVSGLVDFLKIQSTCSKYGVSLNGASYFELGCASGRVIRHLASQTTADIWCCDLNLRHTEWIRLYLPASIKAFNNHALPHLPLPDGSFDFVSAFSVFTHIDDFEFAWLSELRRILRPGGIAYISIQTENTWEKYKHGWIKEQLLPLSEQISEFKINAELFDGPLQKEKTVFWWPAQDVYNSTVFHTIEYIYREWGRYFEVLEIRENGHVYQDVVILRRSQ